MRLLLLGDEDGAGGVAVEPMDDASALIAPHPLAGVAQLVEVMEDGIDEGAGPVALGRMHHHVGRRRAAPLAAGRGRRVALRAPAPRAAGTPPPGAPRLAPPRFRVAPPLVLLSDPRALHDALPVSRVAVSASGCRPCMIASTS